MGGPGVSPLQNPETLTIKSVTTQSLPIDEYKNFTSYACVMARVIRSMSTGEGLIPVLALSPSLLSQTHLLQLQRIEERPLLSSCLHSYVSCNSYYTTLWVIFKLITSSSQTQPKFFIKQISSCPNAASIVYMQVSTLYHTD